MLIQPFFTKESRQTQCHTDPLLVVVILRLSITRYLYTTVLFHHCTASTGQNRNAKRKLREVFFLWGVNMNHNYISYMTYSCFIKVCFVFPRHKSHNLTQSHWQIVQSESESFTSGIQWRCICHVCPTPINLTYYCYDYCDGAQYCNCNKTLWCYQSTAAGVYYIDK